jgi:hypothetical protein
MEAAFDGTGCGAARGAVRASPAHPGASFDRDQIFLQTMLDA